VERTDRPLDGITLLDFTHGVAGPYGVMLLADLGADVWKIERPGRGDPTRYMNVSDRFVTDIPTSGGDYFLAINRNKRSVAIDLRSPRGREIALSLAAQADIVVSNFRPGVMDRLGLGYDDCRSARRDVIYATLSAYGDTGPLAGQPGMDVAIQARSGVMSITGSGSNTGPIKPGASIADFGGGSHLCSAILAALVRRSTKGGAQQVHVSLLDAMMSLLTNYSVAVMDGSAEVGPMGSGHPQLVPFQAFPTSDGWIVIATGTNRLFADLCTVLRLPALVGDSRFETNVTRVKHRDALVQILSAALVERTTAEWQTIFEAQGIPSSPVNTLAQAFAEEQLTSQGMVQQISHATYGSLHQLGAPFTFDGHRPELILPPPLLGEHTEEVLNRFLGLTALQVEDLLQAGVIGSAIR
jgi:crotonobetainyl-CoA:carnitine CoA-transferase CaiB-like acyl-CoA transferase